MSVQRTRRLHATPDPPKSYGAAPLAASPSAPDEVLVGTASTDAFWLGFTAVRPEMPTALRIIVEEPRLVDAISGAPTVEHELRAMPQNYLVCPQQRALDGVYVSTDCVSQFVTSPPGAGACSVLLIEAFAARASLPAPRVARKSAGAACDGITQVLIDDPFGLHCWDSVHATGVRLRFLPPHIFSQLTGLPPPTQLDEQDTYRGWRLP